MPPDAPRFPLGPATTLKVCGLRTHENASALISLGVDALGFNFWPGSKRHLAPDDAGWLAGLAGAVVRVGLFVNPEQPLLERVLAAAWIDLIQLHGEEPPQLTSQLANAGHRVIKALGADPEHRFIAAARAHRDAGAHAILLDAHAPLARGGTGRAIDWSLLAKLRAAMPDCPLILAGGLTPSNAAAAILAAEPDALDVASGVESSPGIQDPVLVTAMLAAVRIPPATVAIPGLAPSR